MWPDLCHVEDVKRDSREVVWMDGLDIYIPGGEVTRLNGSLEIQKMPVRLGPCQLSAFSVGEVVDTLIRDNMNTDVMMRRARFGEFVRVPAVGVHMAHRRWKPSVTEEEHQSMDALLVIDVKVPKHVSIG